MPLIVRGLRVELDEPEDVLRERAARRLKIPVDVIRTISAVRRSLDARDQHDIHYIYNAAVALENPAAEREAVYRRRRPDVQPLKTEPPSDIRPGHEPLRHRPVIIGFGPAGMFAGLRMAEHGYRPLILERGRDVTRRHADVIKRFYQERDFDPESNLLFGEGGAGAYSDGKLYTHNKDPRQDEVRRIFYEFGAYPGVVTDGRPHIGSDRLPNICRRMRLRIEELGGEVRFEQRVTALALDAGRVTGVLVNGETLPADAVLLAIGHSARDLIRAVAAQGVTVTAKPFQVGVRVEHPQAMVDRWQYGAACESVRLPPADYHVVARGAAGPAGDVFSFCMCPGGVILPTNESAGLIATNGASNASRSGGLANSGLVLTIDPVRFGGDPFAALAMQEALERRAFELTGATYRVPVQRAADLIAARPSDGELVTSYPLGGAWTDLRALFDHEIIAAVCEALQRLDRKMPGYAGGDTLVTGPETRASSPVRIPRDANTRQSISTSGLYPVGEGAGYAGGILSAAIDGLRSAEAVVSRFMKPQ